MNHQAEAWLRGPLPDIPALVMPVFFTFTQVQEDLAKHTADINNDQLWTKPNGSASLGFHLKHLAGSIDRITTYLTGQQLTAEQLDALKRESESTGDLDQLLAGITNAIQHSQQRLLQVKPESLYDPRLVGRRALPTTVIGLIVHLAEHTQRHLGQAVTTAKIVRNK